MKNTAVLVQFYHGAHFYGIQENANFLYFFENVKICKKKEGEMNKT